MQGKNIKRLELPNEEVRVTSRTVSGFCAHLHSYYELLLYRPFQGTVTVNNLAIGVHTPTAILIAPGDLHKIEVQPNQTAPYIKLEVNRCLFAGRAEPQGSFWLPKLQPDSMVYLAFQQALKAAPGSDYLQLLILLICNRLQALGQPISPIFELPGLHLAAQAAQILQAGFCEPLCLTGVAQQLKVSPQYLSQVFKKNMGVGFSAYLNRLRLRQAARLLQQKNATVTGVCYDCGFQNLSYFLRAFKKHYGVTPGRYRSSAN